MLNVIAVVHVTVSPGPKKIFFTTIIIAASLPIGWLLFSSGLSAPVEKYGITFRGADFLLGPDRREILPESILMIRWGLIQVGAVAAARIRDAHPASRPTDTGSICITSSGLKAPRVIQI